MIKIKTKEGETSVEARGSDGELYADACIITRSIYTSLKDELKDKNVAEDFKKAVMDGSVFEGDDDMLKIKMLKSILEDILKQIEKEDDD